MQSNKICDCRIQIPQLCWLGIQAKMLGNVPRSAFQSLSQRDHALIKTLRSVLHHPDWIHELDVMSQTGLKCDIEAIYNATSLSGFSEMLTHCIHHGIFCP